MPFSAVGPMALDAWLAFAVCVAGAPQSVTEARAVRGQALRLSCDQDRYEVHVFPPFGSAAIGVGVLGISGTSRRGRGLRAKSEAQVRRRTDDQCRGQVRVLLRQCDSQLGYRVSTRA